MASRYLENLSDPDFNVLSDFSYCSEISKLKNKIHRKSSELSISATFFFGKMTLGGSRSDPAKFTRNYSVVVLLAI